MGVGTYHHHNHNAIVGHDHIDKYDCSSKERKNSGEVKIGEFARGQGGILNHLGRPENQISNLAPLDRNEIDYNQWRYEKAEQNKYRRSHAAGNAEVKELLAAVGTPTSDLGSMEAPNNHSLNRYIKHRNS